MGLQSCHPESGNNIRHHYGCKSNFNIFHISNCCNDDLTSVTPRNLTPAADLVCSVSTSDPSRGADFEAFQTQVQMRERMSALAGFSKFREDNFFRKRLELENFESKLSTQHFVLAQNYAKLSEFDQNQFLRSF